MDRARHASRPSRRSGFTIVEAIVVIALMGILVSVAAPRFLSVSDLDAAQAKRQALSDLRFAQRRAMSSGCPVQVDFAAGSYTLTQRSGCRTGAFGQALVDPVTNVAPYAITLKPGLAITSSVDPMVFDAVGRVTTTAGITTDATVTIAGRTIEAVGETGLIRVP